MRRLGPRGRHSLQVPKCRLLADFVEQVRRQLSWIEHDRRRIGWSDSCFALLGWLDSRHRPSVSPASRGFGRRLRGGTHRGAALFAKNRSWNRGRTDGYGASIRASFRRAAAYVDKIFRGANPADLPVETPTTFEFAISPRADAASRRSDRIRSQRGCIDWRITISPYVERAANRPSPHAAACRDVHVFKR